MSGEFLRHDGGKSREVDLLSLDIVHEAGEIGGKRRGLCRRNRLKAGSFAERFGHHAAKGENELHQSDAALQLTDNLRPGDAFDSTILGAEDEGGLLVRIAERPDARQQQSIAFRLGEERLAERARRAAGW